MLALLQIIGIIMLGTVGVIWKGVVLSIMWVWFAVPLFGLPALGIAAAIGVSLVVAMLTHQNVHTEDTRSFETKFASSMGTIFLYPALILGIGWIVKSFM